MVGTSNWSLAVVSSHASRWDAGSAAAVRRRDPSRAALVPEKMLAVDGDASALLPGQGEDGLGCRTVGMQVGGCRGDEAI
jgi:hypothetical protein